MSTRTDPTHMRRALRLAERGRGRTAPNPPVGAIVVAGGAIVGSGWHRGPGQPHAEVVALEEAGERARGATLYITLEPCTRHGRTPPCAPRVVAAGIARVVIAIEDPNPAECGAGVRALEAAGVDVSVGVLAEDAHEIIAGFASSMREGTPLVRVKVASTLDGRVAAADGSSRWITGPAARRDGHRMRAHADAVVVGIGTVLADDPALTCRLRGYDGPQPVRVVLDSSGRTPTDAVVLDGAAPTLIATTAKAGTAFLEAMGAAGAEVLVFPARHGRVDLEAVIRELGRRGMLEVLIEGGPTIIGDALENGLIDRYAFYLAPKLLGAHGAAAIEGLVVPNIADARELTIIGVRRLGADVRIDARPRV